MFCKMRSLIFHLPVGAIKPNGWLLDELKLQAAGLSGQLPWFWNYFNDSAWLGGKGSEPEQFIPYYLNGLVPLSYQVEDENIASIRKHHVDYILQHQDNATGWLGKPVANNEASAHNYWSKYLAIQALESYAEANPEDAKQRVEPALLRHHQAFHDALKTNGPPLALSRWGFGRYSEAIVGIQWLIDRGHNDSFLWELMHLIRDPTENPANNLTDWQTWYESGDPFAKWNEDPSGAQHLLHHGVDIGEAMKTGALWWRVSGDEHDRQNSYTSLMWADKYAAMSDGMYYADENLFPPHTPSRGTETCSVVETMNSMRYAYEITGNITFMDRLEVIAFNSFPAALWPDVTSNVYHHCSNQIGASGGPYAYALFFCCTANLHQGWPKFVLSLVHTQQKSGGGGSAVVVSGYAPSATTISAAGGAATISVSVGGQYPFADDVNITITASAMSSNSSTHQGAVGLVDELVLRIPCWTDGAEVTISSVADDGKSGGGSGTGGAAKPCTFMTLPMPHLAAFLAGVQARRQPGQAQAQAQAQAAPQATADVFSSTVQVRFRNSIRVKRDPWAGNATEVHRGALTFALRPETSVTTAKIKGHGSVSGAPTTLTSHTVHATGAWNYALDLGTAAADGSPAFVFNGSGVVPARVPFDATAPPAVSIRAQARLIPTWYAKGDHPDPPPSSPVGSVQPLTEITLVPFGATNVRMSVFPVLGDVPPPAPSPGPKPPAPTPPAHCSLTNYTSPPNSAKNTNRRFNDIISGGTGLTADDPQLCYQMCLQQKGLCKAWVYARAGCLANKQYKPWCWPKTAKGTVTQQAGFISGTMP
eukprot:g1190.t1